MQTRRPERHLERGIEAGDDRGPAVRISCQVKRCSVPADALVAALAFPAATPFIWLVDRSGVNARSMPPGKDLYGSRPAALHPDCHT
jgi:hypothetical protein